MPFPSVPFEGGVTGVTGITGLFEGWYPYSLQISLAGVGLVVVEPKNSLVYPMPLSITKEEPSLSKREPVR